MANMSDNPDSEASKWFKTAIVVTALYVSAAFYFVVTADVEPDSTRPEVQYGQSD
jgi:hypothetical protein